MDKIKRTAKDKWDVVVAISVLTVFTAGLVFLAIGMVLTSSADNYEKSKTFELPLEELTVNTEQKGEETYRYKTEIGPKKFTESVTIKQNEKTEERVEIVVVDKSEEEKIIVTDYKLKNEFFDKWMKKYNHVREYVFFVHEENWLDSVQ